MPPRPLERRLALSRGWLTWALVAATLFPTAAALRGLYLSIYFEPTEVALYAARVGHNLGGAGAAMALMLLALAVGIRWVAPPSSTSLTLGIAVAIAVLLGLTGAAWVSANRALNPFDREFEALAAFAPPPGAAHAFDIRHASEHPEVQRYWNVPGSVREVCDQAVARAETWAPASAAVKLLPHSPTGCYYRLQRLEHKVELIVSPSSRDPGVTMLSLRLRRL